MIQQRKESRVWLDILIWTCDPLLVQLYMNTPEHVTGNVNNRGECIGYGGDCGRRIYRSGQHLGVRKVNRSNDERPSFSSIVPLPPLCPSSDQRNKASATRSTKGWMVSPHLDSPARVNGFWWVHCLLFYGHMELKRKGEGNELKHIGCSQSNMLHVCSSSTSWIIITLTIIYYLIL